MRRRQHHIQQNNDDFQGFPSIPSATLTGMRSFIQGVKRNHTINYVNNDCAEDTPLYVHPHQIMVTNAIDVDIDSLNRYVGYMLSAA